MGVEIIHHQNDLLWDKLQRTVKIYALERPTSATDVIAKCEEALAEYEGGEPRIPKRELVAYLVVAKLARGDYWAGDAKYKAFLKKSDLPKGGFPKNVSSREVFEAVDALTNSGILRGDKEGPKYGLARKSIVAPILDKKSFSGHRDEIFGGYRKMEKWCRRGKETVPARDLNSNYG